ncbi:MAG: ATPase domain-containing protein [Candidatus Methanoperedens sp.]
MERIQTGITGLDEMIGGGYPKGRTMLVLGMTGSGKTILGLSFIHKACMEGRKSLIIATEELPGDVIAQSGSVGMDLEEFNKNGLLGIDKVYEERTGHAKELLAYGITDTDKLQSNIIGLLERIPRDVESVLIDNLGVFTLNMSANEFRSQIDSLVAGLTKRNITALLIMDLSADNRTENIASYSVYGVLRTSIKDNPFTGARERLLEVLKIRNTKISLSPIMFEITSKGIEFLKKGTGEIHGK